MQISLKKFSIYRLTKGRIKKKKITKAFLQKIKTKEKRIINILPSIQLKKNFGLVFGSQPRTNTGDKSLRK